MLTATLPQKLNAGEREAIAFCQQHRLPLRSNDRRAIRYCEANGIIALDLPTLLRMLWTRGHTPQAEVQQLITRMEQMERLNLSAQQRAAIFAPQRR